VVVQRAFRRTHHGSRWGLVVRLQKTVRCYYENRGVQNMSPNI
jgi:hypothetical protein